MLECPGTLDLNGILVVAPDGPIVIEATAIDPSVSPTLEELLQGAIDMESDDGVVEDPPPPPPPSSSEPELFPVGRQIVKHGWYCAEGCPERTMTVLY